MRHPVQSRRKTQHKKLATVLCTVAIFLLPCCLQYAWAGEVRVAVAANFTAPFNKLIPDFADATGHRLIPSFGSTGKLYAQIKNGAPFDAFLAADQARPERLLNESTAVPGSRFTYACGKLALWSPKPDYVHGKEALQKPELVHLALASPKLAPYGAAAVEAMKKLGLYEALQVRFVQGENLSQTRHFVATGNAELGFLALSQISLNGQIKTGSAWIVPSDLHAPIRQDAVLLVRGKDNTAASAFIAYLKSERAKAIIRTFGYDS